MKTQGEDRQPIGLCSYVSCEARVPKDHPLRVIRAMADEALEVLSPQFEGLHTKSGRPSLAPDKLLRSLLLQALYSIRSERQLIEQLDYNLLFRWFVGLPVDTPRCDVAVFSKNRERLLANDMPAQFLAAVLRQPRVEPLLSDERFSRHSTLIEAWALPKSFESRDRSSESPGRGCNAERDVYGENGERLPYYPARSRVSF